MFSDNYIVPEITWLFFLHNYRDLIIKVTSNWPLKLVGSYTSCKDPILSQENVTFQQDCAMTGLS